MGPISTVDVMFTTPLLFKISLFIPFSPCLTSTIDDHVQAVSDTKGLFFSFTTINVVLEKHVFTFMNCGGLLRRENPGVYAKCETSAHVHV